MSHATQISTSPMIESCKVTVKEREYTCDGRVSYACEVDVGSDYTISQIRRVMCYLTNVIGTPFSMKQYVGLLYMSKVWSTDRELVDVSHIDRCKSTFMYRVDSVKVYVSCYVTDYAVTLSDPSLTILSYVVAVTNSDMVSITKKPDVLVAETMADGSLFYIDTLCKDSVVVPKPVS